METNKSMSSFKTSTSLFLETIPFFLVNILFRLCSYSFILVFLDYWAFIPFTIAFFINVIICGTSFIKFPESQNMEIFKQDPKGNESILPSAQIDNFECESVGWNPSIMVANSNTFSDQVNFDKELDILSPESGPCSLNKRLDVNITKHVNEDNTPVFLNSVAGFFFPSCHTKVNSLSENQIENVFDIITWQMKIYSKQILLFNTVILVVIGTIFTLVTSINSFNYKSNVLDITWFKRACLVLFI